MADRPVFVPVAPSAEAPAPIYSIFTDPKAPGEALATVEAVDRFRAQRKSRKPTLSALTVIGLRAKDPEVRKEAAFDLGNRQVQAAYPELLKLSSEDQDPQVQKAAAVAVAKMKLDGNTGTEVGEADLITAAENLASYGAFGAIDRLDNKLAEGNSVLH